MSKSLMDRLVEAGYPKEQMYNHESDLYIYVTTLTTKVLEGWCKDSGWNPELVHQNRGLCSTFTDNVTHKKMYDVAFLYLPWWDDKYNATHNDRL